jgi:arylsulfatase A-like enzyme
MSDRRRLLVATALAAAVGLIAILLIVRIGRPRSQPASPNILWIVLDTVRADAIGGTLNGQPITPAIDQLAAAGTTFVNAFAPAPWTVPSHASMFTGRYSFEHRATHSSFSLPLSAVTLAERLQVQGYATGAFVCNPWLNDQNGFSQGFELWQQPSVEVGRGSDKGAATATEMVLSWLDQRRGDGRPFFAFINLLEAHLPYQPPPQVLLRMGWPEEALSMGGFSIEEAERLLAGEREIQANHLVVIRTLYQSEVSYADEHVGVIADALQRLRSLDDTLVIITSDHGEHIGEHGLMGHEFSLFDPVLHVPLIIRYPRLFEKGQRIKTPVSLVDLVPTVLEIIGEDLSSENLAGRTLLTRTAAEEQERPILAEYERPEKLINHYWRSKHPGVDMSRYDVALKALRQGEFKYIVDSEGNEALYRLVEDPHEQRDVASAYPAVVSDLRARLDDMAGMPTASQLPPSDIPETDPELLQRLRSLGYVN